VAVLFAVFVVVAVVFGQTSAAGLAYDLDSRQPNGLLLLRRWLEALDYRVATTSGPPFNIPPGAQLMLVYPGQAPFTTAEATRLAAWVEAGGTLAIIGNGDAALAEVFAYERTTPNLTALAGPARQVQPLLPAAPAVWRSPGAVSAPRPSAAAVPVLANAGGQPLVWVEAYGAGVLWLMAEWYAFTNADLLENEQPHLLLALLRTVPAAGVVVFDTYHLFGDSRLANGRIVSIQDWVYGTPTGWAALFLLLLGAVYLVLSGGRLGPPLALAGAGRRRQAAEFVVAMAGLQRRAHVRDSVARHHHHRLRLGLGRPHRIPSDLDDTEFVQRLRDLDPGLDAAQAGRIGRVLAGLSQLPDEQTLVALVAEVDEILGRE
jgi:hypothetical protein